MTNDTGRQFEAINDQARRFKKRRDLRSESFLFSLGIVLWFLSAAVVQAVSPIATYLMMSVIYVWTVFGHGAAKLRGAWPATFMMEDLRSESGVWWLFLTSWIVHTFIIIALVLD